MELKKLSNKFYSIYNNSNYPNILRKKNRAYSLYTIEYDNNKYGIPVKTNIKHSSSFLFKNSGRKQSGEKPGLDYKHSVIIKDESYIDGDGHIDSKEMKDLINNEDKIVNDYIKFLKGYIKYVNNPIGKFWESWRYINTSLEYFWKDLGLIIPDEAGRRKEIKFSYNIYLIVKNLCKDTKASTGNFLVRKIDDKSVSISYLSFYVIKNLELCNINDYIEIVTSYDLNGDISHSFNKGSCYNNLLNKLNKILEKQI